MTDKNPRISWSEEADEFYSRSIARRVLFIFLSVLLLAILALAATSLGGASLGIGDVSHALIARIFPFAGAEGGSVANVIIWHLRLPRIVMGIVAGAGLALAGAAVQGALRNPLVSPFTIGVSSGAALGASVAIILGFGLVGSEKYVVIANAFVFAMGTSLLILGIGRLRGISSESFILVGIALMYLFGAVTSLLQYIATEEELAEVIHWAFGTLTGSSWENIAVVSAVMAFCLPWLMKYSWDLNAMASGGDEVATSLGVNCGRVRIAVMALSALVTASVICFTGIIGFVCLVAPHIARFLIGGDHRFLLPCSSVLGAILLLAADTIGRTAFSPAIIPVGIVISFIGPPFFIYLLLRRRRGYWQ